MTASTTGTERRRRRSAKARNRGGWGTVVQRALWGFEPGVSLGCKPGYGLTALAIAGFEVLGCRWMDMGDSFRPYRSSIGKLIGRGGASRVIAGGQPTARSIGTSQETVRLAHEVSILISLEGRLGRCLG